VQAAHLPRPTPLRADAGEWPSLPNLPPKVAPSTLGRNDRMLKLAQLLALAAAVSLVLGVVGHFGVKALWVVAQPDACLEFAQACAMLGILLLLIAWAAQHAKPAGQ
jgi:succinate dehydrogenase hydrophobic anchor subunit